MIAFMQVFEDIATAVLLPVMNVAVGATMIAALAVIVSRLWFLSLPLRHAICVCGVAGAIAAPPLILSLESLASRFTEIGISEWPVLKRTNSELVAAPQQLTHDANLPSASLNHQPARLPQKC